MYPATLADPWLAPRAAGPIDATITVPGSKSVTNRALVLAALATGPSTIRGALVARDTLLMAAALRSLGAGISEVGTTWQVEPAALGGEVGPSPTPPRTSRTVTIDVGLAGTVLRFVPAVAALAADVVAFDGDPRARERPVGPLLAALRTLGAEIDDGGRGGLPFTIRGNGGVRGGPVTIDASSSSQFVSGLLLSASRFQEGLALRHVGPPVPSAPQLALTVQMLRDAGATVEADPQRSQWTVRPGPLAGREVRVDPDLSTAAPFVAAALVTGGQVRVPGWPRRAHQPGDRLPELLTAMGARCVLDDAGLTVTGGDQVEGVDAELGDCTELVPVLVAVAALARTPSRLRGIGHMRGHETDRLAALAGELTGLGGEVSETADGLRISPRPLHGGTFATYHDHRLAMAAAVLGLVVDGVLVKNMATTAKTVPDFTARWAALLAGTAAGAPTEPPR